MILLSLFLAFWISSCQSTLPIDKVSFSYPEFKKKDLSGSKESPLRLLSDRPLCAETKVHELDDQVTPIHKMFVRNNGWIPEKARAEDFSDWFLLVDGEVERPKRFSLEDLKNNFPIYEFQLTLECGGNGRAGYSPRTKGHQWTYGAISCALWKGVRLKDVLEFVGVKNSAVYLAFEAEDLHLSGDSKKQVMSRGVPLVKALDPMTLLAFELNGRPLPPEHGAPLRLMCPGYPGSASGKWLTRLWVRDQVHDGAKMMGNSYRTPKEPVKPGEKVKGGQDEWKIIEKMPVKSMITYPKSNTVFSFQKKPLIQVRGFAWTGEGDITEVQVSYDYGATWQSAELERARNPFAWQRWSVNLQLPSKGYYQIWAKAKDSTGASQPMLVPAWNPKGYLNNAAPQIALSLE